jgi:hypothetical protein
MIKFKLIIIILICYGMNLKKKKFINDVSLHLKTNILEQMITNMHIFDLYN